MTLQLADHVEAPVFNIDCNTAPLPHDPATGRRLTTPWQFDWLRFDPEALAIKEVTAARDNMSGWPELLRYRWGAGTRPLALVALLSLSGLTGALCPL